MRSDLDWRWLLQVVGQACWASGLLPLFPGLGRDWPLAECGEALPARYLQP